jgi:hypothetical protein
VLDGSMIGVLILYGVGGTVATAAALVCHGDLEPARLLADQDQPHEGDADSRQSARRGDLADGAAAGPSSPGNAPAQAVPA